MAGVLHLKMRLNNSILTTVDDPTSSTHGPSDLQRYKLASNNVCVRCVSSLSAEEICHWRELASCSIEPNPFLSPNFILPLLQEIPPLAPVQMMVVTDSETGEWRAAGLFETPQPTLKRPLSYAHGLTSPYTFLTGILVDSCSAQATLDATFAHCGRSRDWHGLHFDSLRADSAFVAAMHQAAALTGTQVAEVYRWSRSQFVCDGPHTIDQVLEKCSRSRRKSLNHARRQLEKQGHVEYRLVIPSHANHECIRTFLELEHSGWKGEAGTAFLSAASTTRFFLGMAESMTADKGLVFGELLLNGEVISSTCNLLTSDVLTAFKIGWNPAFADYAPGLWSEVYLASTVSRELPHITRIDSSAKSGSYVEAVWKTQQPMISVTYSWSRRGQTIESLRSYYRSVKNWLEVAKIPSSYKASP